MIYFLSQAKAQISFFRSIYRESRYISFLSLSLQFSYQPQSGDPNQQYPSNYTPAADGSATPAADVSIYQPGNDGEIELHVGEPTVVKSGLTEHHSYPIVGRDSIGDIECQRRF